MLYQVTVYQISPPTRSIQITAAAIHNTGCIAVSITRQSIKTFITGVDIHSFMARLPTVPVDVLGHYRRTGRHGPWLLETALRNGSQERSQDLYPILQAFCGALAGQVIIGLSSNVFGKPLSVIISCIVGEAVFSRAEAGINESALSSRFPSTIGKSFPFTV